MYSDFIEHVWDKLPEHVNADLEIRTYHCCDEHYNQSWQRTYIDGPAPKIKDCSECRWTRRSAESNDKRASFRVIYSRLPILRPGHSVYETTSQRGRGHKSAGRVPRHCVFSEQRSHVVNKVFADKALGRIVTRDSALSKRVAAATVWAVMKAKISMGMKSKKKTTRKKAMKKLPTMKRGGYVIVSANVGSARVLDRRSG